MSRDSTVLAKLGRMERRSVWILSEGGRKSRGSTLESWFSEGAERPGLELEAVWNWKVRSAYFEAAWTEVGDADTQSQRAPGAPRSEVGGEGLHSGSLDPAPFRGR